MRLRQWLGTGSVGYGGSRILGLHPFTRRFDRDCRMRANLRSIRTPGIGPVQRYVGLGVIGLLAGNAIRMFVGEGIERDSILFGLLISLGIPVYVV